MATVTIAQYRKRQFGSVPYGNKTVLPFKLKTVANGGVPDANSSAALAVNDKVILGTLPAGMLVTDHTVIVSTGLTATLTGDLGIEYADGVDSPVLPQSATMYGAGIALHTAARLRSSSVAELIKLPKDANLVLTIKTVANAKAGVVDFVIEGEL